MQTLRSAHRTALLLCLVARAAGLAATCTVQPSRRGSCLDENIDAPGYEGSCNPRGGPCNRCLSYFVGGAYNDHVTREGCACLCHQKGFMLAGVENGNNCYCGNGTGGAFCGGAATTGCDQACTGNATQTACGGPNRVDVLTFACPDACLDGRRCCGVLG